MALDIGPRIGIDGEAEFRKQIKALTEQVKTFGSEMAVVTAEFEGNEDSIEALTAQNKVLNKSIDAQKKKLEELKKGLENAQDAFGDGDERTLKWQRAVNNATESLKKMESKVRKNDASMEKLASEIRENEDSLEELEDELDDAGEAMKDAGKQAVGLGDILKANLASDIIVNALETIIGSFRQMAEESREYRKIMGSLEISSEQAGYTAEQTAESYRNLYGVLADNQTAATTTANLQAIGLAQEDLNALINGTVGAWAKYGDSIPIDGLAEAINETVKVGEVTGTFADVLNWAGTSEDAFNEKLAAAASETERANMVLEELANQGLVDAGMAWQENNKSLVEANQATEEYEAVTARLGETVEPVLTMLQEGTNDILSSMADLLEFIDFEQLVGDIGEVSDFFSGLVDGIVKGDLTLEEAYSKIREALQDILQKISDEIVAAGPDILEKGSELIEELAVGMIGHASDVYEVIGEIRNGILSLIAEALPDILDSGAAILTSIVAGIAQELPQMASAGVDIIGELVGTLLENLPEILESGIKLIGELTAGIIMEAPDLLLEFAGIVEDIAQKILDYDWLKIGGDILRGLANGILGCIGTVADAVDQASSAIANAFLDFFDIHSPSIKMRDEVGKQITAGIAEGILANKAYAKKSAEEVSDAILKAAQKKLDNYKVYNSLTLADETAFWNEIRIKTADGTQARIDADAKYFDAKKKLNDQLLENEQDYKENVTRIHEELSDNIQDAWNTYYDKVDSLSDSIKSQMGLFDFFDAGTDMTADDLMQNLESQVDGLRSWRDSLDSLRDRDISSEFVHELEEMGVSAAGEVALLADMTDAELNRYVRLWHIKCGLAREEAEEQLEPLLQDTRGQIQKLRQLASEELGAYQQEYVAAMEALGGLIEVPLEHLQGNLVNQAATAVGAMADSIKSNAESPENQEKYRMLSECILASAMGLPDDFQMIGKDLVSGMIAGIESQMNELDQVMAGISNRMSMDGMEYSVPTNAGSQDSLIDGMCQAFSNVQVVMQDGTVVGQLSPSIDSAIGGYAKVKARYGT